MKKNLSLKIYFLPLIVTLFIVSCAPFTARFSPHAYQTAVTLKVESLELMDKATDKFSKHKGDVEKFKTKLKIAYEYAKGIPNNTSSTAQWKKLISPDGHLLGGFFNKWKSEKKLRPGYISEKKEQVSKGFDEIIKLETQKNKK